MRTRSERRPSAPRSGFVAVFTLAVLLRRSRPVTALAVVGLGYLATSVWPGDQVTPPPALAQAGVWVAAFSAIAAGTTRLRLAAIAALGAFVAADAYRVLSGTEAYDFGLVGPTRRAAASSWPPRRPSRPNGCAWPVSCTTRWRAGSVRWRCGSRPSAMSTGTGTPRRARPSPRSAGRSAPRWASCAARWTRSGTTRPPPASWRGRRCGRSRRWPTRRAGPAPRWTS